MLLLSKYLPAATAMGRLELEYKAQWMGGEGGGVEEKEEECGGGIELKKKKKKAVYPQGCCAEHLKHMRLPPTIHLQRKHLRI